VPNPDQADADDDGIGDSCEAEAELPLQLVGGACRVGAGSTSSGLAGVLLVLAGLLLGRRPR